MKKEKIKVLSLFSGCGGLDLGFLGGFEFSGIKYKRLDTEIVFANDFDIDAVTCYNSNPLLARKSTKAICKDVRDISSESFPDFDIMIAGFPCQPFSNAGNRKGVNDKNGRGTLFEECERVLKFKISQGHKPKAFLFENVRGILSSKMPDGKTTVPDEIKSRMEKLGYNVSLQLICASDYGVPQKRHRVLIVGIDKQIGTFDFLQLKKTVQEQKIPSDSFGKKEHLLLGFILKDVPKDDFWGYTQATKKMVELIGPCLHGPQAIEFFKSDFSINNMPKLYSQGKSWKDIPPENLSERFKKIYDNPKKYHSPKFFRRFAFGEINGTITASAQPENCGITHPIENRRFSVREIARIQSFPDEYDFSKIPLQSRYKVIGNAVPPVLGWVIANSLLKSLQEK